MVQLLKFIAGVACLMGYARADRWEDDGFTVIEKDDLKDLLYPWSTSWPML